MPHGDASAPILTRCKQFQRKKYKHTTGVETVMLKATITVESGCRFQIPREIAEPLGIAPGMKLSLSVGSDALTIEPMPFRINVFPRKPLKRSKRELLFRFLADGRRQAARVQNAQSGGACRLARL
jgi:bifunctional DNA-binding transcriptional regulator/antitoxin component of YhaV-PrlF toxin-antitoxin module